MDISSIQLAIYKSLLWIVPFAIAIAVIRSNWFKGVAGEALIGLLAKMRLPKDTYHTIHNVTLPTSDGSTQIDHIFVSRFGIFVVETKNMKGWIFGSENQKQWTQKIYKKTYKFQNPLHQNYKHLKTLELALDIPESALKSVVVFTGESELKTSMPENVTKGIGFISYIKSFDSQILTDEMVRNAVNTINAERFEPNRSTNKRHIEMLSARSNIKDQRKCPKCGKDMILRTAKKGENVGNNFWGCSGFPMCRTVENI